MRYALFWVGRELFDLWDAVAYRWRLMSRGPIEIETAIAHVQAGLVALEEVGQEPAGGMVIDDTDYQVVTREELDRAVAVLKRLGNYE